MALLGLSLWPGVAAGQEPQRSLSFDGFLDAYYTWDFNQHPGRVRPFATEPARHNEFAVGLALLRAQYGAERVRASVGLATGTYIEANYAAEPDLLKNIFEAYAGIELGGGAWLDAGVLPSHIGFESAITSSNMTYSRSLIAELSPYYETGARLTVQPSDRFSAALLVVNGWQIIRETNGAKSAGVQLQFRPRPNLLLNYSNYLGDEAPDDDETGGRLIRFFHDFYAQLDVSGRLTLTGAFDVGTQELPADESATWYGAALVGRWWLSERWAVGMRGELFHDPDQVVAVSGTPAGLEAVGGSLNLDYRPAERVLLRIEGRLFDANDPVFPSDQGLERTDALLSTSLAVTF
jgi:hypothetical protein